MSGDRTFGVDKGYRVVPYSRPGYGASTPAPGRTVAGAADLAAGMASLFPEVDAAELAGAYGAENMAHMHHALAPGEEGWLGDFQALTTPWGFDLGGVTVPVEL
ncbi:hypothetical protein AB0K18_09525 [Nonomuraea sp. NPDC049421]|uniref:hypothetical protein n=1 Tax=Nonomuraea sp. NPDC049421 TaxID=3155275 RepID=UPI00341DB642